MTWRNGYLDSFYTEKMMRISRAICNLKEEVDRQQVDYHQNGGIGWRNKDDRWQKIREAYIYILRMPHFQERATKEQLRKLNYYWIELELETWANGTNRRN